MTINLLKAWTVISLALTPLPSRALTKERDAEKSVSVRDRAEFLQANRCSRARRAAKMQVCRNDGKFVDIEKGEKSCVKKSD